MSGKMFSDYEFYSRLKIEVWHYSVKYCNASSIVLLDTNITIELGIDSFIWYKLGKAFSVLNWTWGSTRLFIYKLFF